MTGGRKAQSRLMCGAAAAAVLAIAGAAQAQAAETTFDIAPQPLAMALKEFGLKTGQPVLYGPALATSKVSPGVENAPNPEAALTALLTGTGLTYKREGDAFLIVQQGEGGSPQADRGAGGAATVEALIVTAQKREEDIQDVPIAISAFSQADLERTQIAGGPDLITQVPNMTFTKTNFTSYSIQLRGIGTQAISATTDPGVAVAFNNTPFIRNRFFEQEFYDLQRVEVLRGPQGTLYGRNATAGVVNIISQKPKFVAESKLSADLANYNSTRLEGMVNIPLVEDAVALRLAGAWTKREGYATNEITGSPIDGRDLWSTRLSLRFSPNDRIDANLIWEHYEENDDRLRSGKQLCHKHIVTAVGDRQLGSFGQLLNDYGQSGFPAQSTFSQGCIRESLYSPNSFETPNGLSVPYYFPLSYIGLPTAFLDPYVSTVQSRDLRVIESTVDPKYKAMADIGELQVSLDITENLTLASETAYGSDFVWSMQDFNRFNTAEGAFRETGSNRYFRDAGVLTEDGTFCDPQIGCSSRLVAVDLSTGKARQFSQELRLSSDFDGPFNFSLGANFLRFDGEDKYYVFINSLTLSRIGDRFSSFDPFDQSGNTVPWIPGVSDNSECARNGPFEGDPTETYFYGCVAIEPNSIENIQDRGHNYFLSKNPYKLISYAMFGEAYYELADNLKLTGGLRWTIDKKEAPWIPSWTLAGEGTIGYPVLEVIEQEWREPTGRLAIDWKPDLAFTDQTMVYASYARGYKAGGANPPPMVNLTVPPQGAQPPSVTRPKTFDAEFIDAFELGAKNTLADGRITLNLAAFYYDYKDYQISEIVDRSAFNRNFDAEIWGLEIEADWRPLENLKLSFKGGYENTRFADGEQAIDLMDRTAGNPDWVVVRPFPTSASSCILPVYVFARPSGGLIGPGGMSGGNPGPCEIAYLGGVDPITELPYVETPPQNTIRFGSYPGYIGFNPLDASQGHNNGEGFFKQIGGNPLPNAPEFTATLSADYTLPLAGDWLATLHSDLYWQSESNWRIFDDHEYNRLDEYITMNLAAIFINEDAGWKVMAYVKNVFDRDSITGAFLNSDDTGLTTNVFLTEPRLYGLRVTKEWMDAPFTTLFGGRNEGPFPLTVEIGGQVQRWDAPYEPLQPAVLANFSPALRPDVQNRDLDWGDGREVKLTYRPGGDWSVSAGVRFGRTNNDTTRQRLEEEGDTVCAYPDITFYGVPIQYVFCDPASKYYSPDAFATEVMWSNAEARSREEHMIADFEVGRDVGLGSLGLLRSAVRLGLRYAHFNSDSAFAVFGVPDINIPEGFSGGKYLASLSHYEAAVAAEREFEGVGPILSWDAAIALLGSADTGRLAVDWSIGGGVLFGEQNTSISGQEQSATWTGAFSNGLFVKPLTVTESVELNVQRSDSVIVPLVDLSLGLSYEIDRIKVGAGYRWERYYDVLDVGFDEARDGDRTIDGPYFKLSVGFGG